LEGRDSEDPTEIARRMELARAEISHWAEFDHVVVNDVFEYALAELRSILHAARTATARGIGLAGFVAGLGG
jgi:guanylate kinase